MKQQAVLVLMLALAACAGPQRPRTPDQVINRALKGAPGQAQPSKVVAAELGFARLAQEKGQWTAFAEYAADDAVMFVPEPVNAKAWLKGRANPSQAVSWQPHKVWMSCDGSLALSKGAWQQPGGSQGYFTTVWQRQKDGEFRWIMDQGDGLEQPLTEPDFIQTEVAKCVGDPGEATNPRDSDGDTRGGTSADGTLVWNVLVRPDNSRHVTVSLWDGGAWQVVLDLDAKP